MPVLQPPARQSVFERVAALDKAKPVFALLSLTIYGLARVSHDAFYAKLGVTVEEAGLDQGTILGRAALYFVFYLAVGLSVAALTLAIAVPLHRRGAPTQSSTRQDSSGRTADIGRTVLPVESPILIALLVSLSVPLIGIIAPQLLFTMVRVPSTEPSNVIRVIGAVVLAVVCLVFLVWRWSAVEEYLRRVQARRSLLVGVCLLLAVLSASALILAKMRGDFLGSEVRDGERVRAFRLELLSVRADPVCLRWLRSEYAVIAPGPYMFLGEARGTWALYDWSQDQPLRVPTGTAILTAATVTPPDERRSREDTYSCPAP